MIIHYESSQSTGKMASLSRHIKVKGRRRKKKTIRLYKSSCPERKVFRCIPIKKHGLIWFHLSFRNGMRSNLIISKKMPNCRPTLDIRCQMVHTGYLSNALQLFLSLQSNVISLPLFPTIIPQVLLVVLGFTRFLETDTSVIECIFYYILPSSITVDQNI